MASKPIRRSNSCVVKSELQDKVMINLMRNWLYRYDHKALVCPRIEPLLKKLVKIIRHLLGEFCYASTPNDLFPIIFLHADKFVSTVGYVDQSHLSGILVSSLTVTIKFYEDRGIMNTWVAEACGVKLREINRMERAFLNQLQFNLMLTPSDINEFFLSHKRVWEERTYYLSSSTTSSSPSFISHSSTSSNISKRARSATTSSVPPSNSRPLLSRNNINTTKTTATTNSSTSSKPSSTATKQVKPEQPALSKLTRFTKSWKVLSFFKRPTIE